MHRGPRWEVMSDGFYAVESETAKAVAIPKGSILLMQKCADPERVRFSVSGKKYWAFRLQLDSHCELRSDRPHAGG